MGRRIGNFGLVNYREHPTDKNHMVLNFNSKPEADMFGSMLSDEKIWHERAEETLNNETLYLFGVRLNDFDRVQKINFLVTAKFRKPMIRNKIARWSLIAFFLMVLTAALVGYVKNSGNLSPHQTDSTAQ